MLHFQREWGTSRPTSHRVNIHQFIPARARLMASSTTGVHMNAIGITKEELRPTGAPGRDVSKEPVPGASHALTPLQQLKPWDHQELVSRNGAGGEVTPGGERGGAVRASATAATLGLLCLGAIVSVLVLRTYPRRKRAVL